MRLGPVLGYNASLGIKRPREALASGMDRSLPWPYCFSAAVPEFGKYDPGSDPAHSFGPNATINRFPVAGAADFETLERELAKRLGSTPERCAFLRSAAYLRFRMRALYQAPAEPGTVHPPEGVSVAYAPGPGGAGGVVTLGWPTGPGALPVDLRKFSKFRPFQYQAF